MSPIAPSYGHSKKLALHVRVSYARHSGAPAIGTIWCFLASCAGSSLFSAVRTCTDLPSRPPLYPVGTWSHSRRSTHFCVGVDNGDERAIMNPLCALCLL